MQQFVETIKVKNGKALALAYHQARMERTIAHFFPALALTAMPRLEEWVAPKADMDLFKARVVYGERGGGEGRICILCHASNSLIASGLRRFDRL